jgi:hypothetical protein
VTVLPTARSLAVPGWVTWIDVEPSVRTVSTSSLASVM